MQTETDEFDDDDEDIDKDETLDEDRTATCPKDGSSLFVDMCEYYCWECEQFYCPICLTICDPLNLMDKGAFACSHYAASEFDGDPTDDLDRDNGLLIFDKDDIDKLGGEGRPPKCVDEFLYCLGSHREQLGGELLSSMTVSELNDRFGALYAFMKDDNHVFAFDYLCKALNIIVRQAYYDDSATPTYYFCPIGGNEAWDIIRPALQQYVDGLTWLEAQLADVDSGPHPASESLDDPHRVLADNVGDYVAEYVDHSLPARTMVAPVATGTWPPAPAKADSPTLKHIAEAARFAVSYARMIWWCRFYLLLFLGGIIVVIAGTVVSVEMMVSLGFVVFFSALIPYVATLIYAYQVQAALNRFGLYKPGAWQIVAAALIGNPYILGLWVPVSVVLTVKSCRAKYPTSMLFAEVAGQGKSGIKQPAGSPRKKSAK